MEWGRWLGLSLIPAVLLFQIVQKAVTLTFPGNSVALVGFWVVFFAWFAATIPFLFRETRSSAWDARIGALSYPLYLVARFVDAKVDEVRRRPRVTRAEAEFGERGLETSPKASAAP